MSSITITSIQNRRDNYKKEIIIVCIIENNEIIKPYFLRNINKTI